MQSESEIQFWFGVSEEDDEAPTIHYYQDDDGPMFQGFKNMDKIRELGHVNCDAVYVPLYNFAAASRIVAYGVTKIFCTVYVDTEVANLLKKCGARSVESPHDGQCFTLQGRHFEQFARAFKG